MTTKNTFEKFEEINKIAELGGGEAGIEKQKKAV